MAAEGGQKIINNEGTREGEGKRRKCPDFHLKTDSKPFKNRYFELKEHGIDPLRLIDPQEGDPTPPRTTMAEAVMSSSSSCGKCGSLMDSDLNFCPSCGEKK